MDDDNNNKNKKKRRVYVNAKKMMAFCNEALNESQQRKEFISNQGLVAAPVPRAPPLQPMSGAPPLPSPQFNLFGQPISFPPIYFNQTFPYAANYFQTFGPSPSSAHFASLTGPVNIIYNPINISQTTLNQDGPIQNVLRTSWPGSSHNAEANTTSGDPPSFEILGDSDSAANTTSGDTPSFEHYGAIEAKEEVIKEREGKAKEAEEREGKPKEAEESADNKEVFEEREGKPKEVEEVHIDEGSGCVPRSDDNAPDFDPAHDGNTNAATETANVEVIDLTVPDQDSNSDNSINQNSTGITNLAEIQQRDREQQAHLEKNRIGTICRIEVDCMICGEPLSNGERCMSLNCKCTQTFHLNCIDEHFAHCLAKNEPSWCPNCKHVFDMDGKRGIN
jgi:hypothetical protein